MKKIDTKHLIPTMGRYTKMVFECPFCGHDVVKNMYSHICGFANTQWGMMKVIECPQCFEKYCSHEYPQDYKLFEIYVSGGNNLHFKKQ